jgi:hypothetical protein
MKYSVYISEKEQQLCNVRIPKNAIMIKDERGNVTLCMDFPRHYKGTNPSLNIWYWDEIHQCFEPDIWRNNTTKVLWKLYVKGGYKKLPALVRPQVESVYSKVPHNTKVGHVQASVMCDPEKKRRNEYSTTDYHCCKPSIYKYYSGIGCYGKAGESMSI